MKVTPLVSIICTTYNHEKYVKKALDGFISQQTNFPFEIIVHDDASTDGTVEILKGYEQKYPSLFRNIYRTENWYSQGKNIWEYLFKEIAKGKYIAICEGDDYWINPLKLQKQIDFLEANEDYSMCFHRVNFINGCIDTQKTSQLYLKHTFIQADIAKRNYINTCSVVFRNNSKQLDFDLLGKCKTADYALWMLLSDYGKLYFFAEIMASYRIASENSIWSKKNSLYQYYNWISTLKLLIKYFKGRTRYVLLYQLFVCILILGAKYLLSLCGINK